MNTPNEKKLQGLEEALSSSSQTVEEKHQKSEIDGKTTPDPAFQEKAESTSDVVESAIPSGTYAPITQPMVPPSKPEPPASHISLQPQHLQPAQGAQQAGQAFSASGQTAFPVPPQPSYRTQAQTNYQNPAGFYAHHAAPSQSSQSAPLPHQAQTYHHPSRQTPSKAPLASASKKSNGGAKTFLFGFLGAALALVIGFVAFTLSNPQLATKNIGTSTTVLGSSGSSIDADDPDDTLAEAVSKKALPSVVNIDVYTEQSSMGSLFGSDSSSSELTESSLGSGVILSEDGYIITNYHVVEAADALEVTVGDESYQATVVGSDPSSDIAVIKAEGARGLTPIEIGQSSDLEVGEWVMTLGSPFGLEQSVATGIVSATSRSQIMESLTGGSPTVYTNLIQTDAAINPGNSGGALVDADGKLIGINTLISSYSGNYSGVGFAIPVDYAISLAQQIIEGKTPTHAQLGVSLATIDSSIAQRYALSVQAGAYVTDVFSGSGAASAGIKTGDIITKFDGKEVTSASDLMLDIRSKNPGDTVSIELNRSGETVRLEVTLGSDGETQQQSMKQSSFGDNETLATAA